MHNHDIDLFFPTIAEREVQYNARESVPDFDACVRRYAESSARVRTRRPGVLDLRVGGSPYFSVDGGATNIAGFSTGQEHGDGWQASHFSNSGLTLMKPTVGFGQSYDAFPQDLMALDANAVEACAVLRRGAPHPEYRQVTLVDCAGQTACFSGSRGLGVHDEAHGQNVVSAGNLLANTGVPQAIVAAFESSDGDLGARVVAAMAAGLAAETVQVQG